MRSVARRRCLSAPPPGRPVVARGKVWRLAHSIAQAGQIGRGLHQEWPSPLEPSQLDAGGASALARAVPNYRRRVSWRATTPACHTITRCTSTLENTASACGPSNSCTTMGATFASLPLCERNRRGGGSPRRSLLEVSLCDSRRLASLNPHGFRDGLANSSSDIFATFRAL
jgi:hypothetical protein